MHIISLIGINLDVRHLSSGSLSFTSLVSELWLKIGRMLQRVLLELTTINTLQIWWLCVIFLTVITQVVILHCIHVLLLDHL